jgi:hypothetical protein
LEKKIFEPLDVKTNFLFCDFYEIFSCLEIVSLN